MGVIGALLIGFAFFFSVVLLTLLLGAFGRREERSIDRRTAEDLARGGGRITHPPSQGAGYGYDRDPLAH